MSLLHYHTCPVCESNNITDQQKIKDFSVSKELFTLSKCADCGFLFTNPVPDEQNIGRYYDSVDYVSHSDTKQGLINTLYHSVRKFTLKGKLKLVQQINGNKVGHLLDVGCGTGYFLNECKNNHWQIAGTEPDPKARKTANEKINNIVKPTLFDHTDQQAFDVITLWHVLEHIHELNRSLTHIHRILKDNKYLVIAVPNYESDDANRYRNYWAAYDVPRHLYHFSKATMEKLLLKHGFKLVSIKPHDF